MKYKLIATDMDGTLLTPDDKITDRTVDAIKKAVEKGVVNVKLLYYFICKKGYDLIKQH